MCSRPTARRSRPAAPPSTCRSRTNGAPAPMRWSPPGVRSPRPPSARRCAPSARSGSALDPDLRTLAVQIAAPEKVTPRQRIEVPLRVANAQRHRRPTSPWPRSTRASCSSRASRRPSRPTTTSASASSASTMRDDYGRLLDARADELGKIRTGGDAGDIGGLDVVPTRTVALFSGPVKLDDKGEAKITLEIPDFIGQLRLMAVAYDKDKVGSADAAAVRARCRHRRRDPAALPGAQRHRPRGAVAAQRRGPGRRLQGRPSRRPARSSLERPVSTRPSGSPPTSAS